MRKSGFLMLLLAMLLVTLPVVAFGLTPDNGPFGLTAETKIVMQEEVAVAGEIMTAYAVDNKPSAVVPIMINGDVASGLRTDPARIIDHTGQVVKTEAQIAGRGPLIAGFLAGALS